MKQVCVFIIAVVLAAAAVPTVGADDAAPGPLPPPGGRRPLIVRRGMLALGGWAVGNIAVATPLALSSGDPVAAGFWEMNALWNTVNLALAAGTLVANDADDGYDTRGAADDAPAATPRPLPTWQDERYRAESHRLEKILLFNAGIDLAYMTLGAWLWDRGTRGLEGPAGVSSQRLTGWGQALVVQGGFLFAFDLVMAGVVARDRRGD